MVQICDIVLSPVCPTSNDDQYSVSIIIILTKSQEAAAFNFECKGVMVTYTGKYLLHSGCGKSGTRMENGE